MTRDHGGNLDVACARFGGRLEDWIDLSTGINRRSYPVPPLAPRHWMRFRRDPISMRFMQRRGRLTRSSASVLAVAGAQAAIQLLPRLAPPGRARILAPTYNEFAPVLAGAGWQVEDVGEIEALAGADLAVVVNPNNPDGRQHDPAKLLALLSRVKRLVIDESFADAVPQLSLAAEAGTGGTSGAAFLRQVLRPRRVAARLRARRRTTISLHSMRWRDLGRSRARPSRSGERRCSIAIGPTRRARGWRWTRAAWMVSQWASAGA